MASSSRSILNSHLFGGNYTDLIVWIGDSADYTKGLTIENETIDHIDIRENIFSKYPTISMTINDVGRFFFKWRLKIGDRLNVIMMPNKELVNSDEDEKLLPYVMSSFTIQSVLNVPDTKNKYYIHKIEGIGSSIRLINNIITYPQNTNLLSPLQLRKSSGDVIKEICEENGIGFSAEVKTFDDSLWISTKSSISDFFDRLLDHGWIEEGDAPILFSDASNILHLTSIKTICNNKAKVTLMDSMERLKQDISPVTEILISNAMTVNIGGPVVNNGGYTTSTSFYTPRNNRSSQSLDEFPEHGMNLISNASSLFNEDIDDRSSSYRTKDYSQLDTFLANVTNKQISEIHNVSKRASGGIHFDELHDHYEVAPNHNELIRRSFFQNFIRVTIDTSRQSSIFNESKYRPRIGTVVKCDFSEKNRIERIHSGEYVVAEIVHRYARSEPYTQSMTLVNDGYFDTGD